MNNNEKQLNKKLYKMVRIKMSLSPRLLSYGQYPYFGFDGSRLKNSIYPW